jgi:3'(2'), 5'-bisphosphate nucleotidase
MERELEVARQVARAAGRVIMEIYGGEHEVQWKGYDDPVTKADHAASELIVKELRRQFPGDGVLSEEAPDDASRLDKRRLWLIDPMDGTKQFVERIGEFSVMIGLAVEGVARLGVVYHPTADRLYYAAPGIGAFVEEPLTTKRLRVSPLSDPSRAIVAMSRSHHSPSIDRARALLGVTETLRSGSVGLKFGLIAEARAHLYFNLSGRTNHWDTCAPEAILREAGGRVTDTTGAPLGYNTPEIRNLRGIVASNGPLHDQALAAVATVRAERG